jgi:predicted AAA+ superfamily ATPase
LAKHEIALNDEARREALKWSLTRGQRSGRAAAQFARHWAGLKMLAGKG